MMSILKGLVRSAGPLLTLGLVFATPPLAQEQAAFGGHGFLHNSAGAPIADAKVKLTGAPTAEANTGADGAFTLPALRGGHRGSQSLPMTRPLPTPRLLLWPPMLRLL
jgi:hypothetical protein